MPCHALLPHPPARPLHLPVAVIPRPAARQPASPAHRRPCRPAQTPARQPVRRDRAFTSCAVALPPRARADNPRRPAAGVEQRRSCMQIQTQTQTRVRAGPGARARARAPAAPRTRTPTIAPPESPVAATAVPQGPARSRTAAAATAPPPPTISISLPHRRPRLPSSSSLSRAASRESRPAAAPPQSPGSARAQARPRASESEQRPAVGVVAIMHMAAADHRAGGGACAERPLFSREWQQPLALAHDARRETRLQPCPLGRSLSLKPHVVMEPDSASAGASALASANVNASVASAASPAAACSAPVRPALNDRPTPPLPAGTATTQTAAAAPWTRAVEDKLDAFGSRLQCHWISLRGLLACAVARLEKELCTGISELGRWPSLFASARLHGCTAARSAGGVGSPVGWRQGRPARDPAGRAAGDGPAARCRTGSSPARRAWRGAGVTRSGGTPVVSPTHSPSTAPAVRGRPHGRPAGVWCDACVMSMCDFTTARLTEACRPWLAQFALPPRLC